MNKIYSWTVIGAGCAGIISIAKLLDEGINEGDILWIDNYFNGGDIAKKWYEVPGNTKVLSFHTAFNTFKSIEYKTLDTKLKNLNPDDVCSLGCLAQALKVVTAKLQQTNIVTFKSDVISIDNTANDIQIFTDSKIFKTKKLILATGAEQKSTESNKTLNIDTALCPNKLKNVDLTNKKIGVVGSSHSAILVIRNLIDAGVTDVYNFYRSFTKYAIEHNGKIIYDNTGLKGVAAIWAKQNLEDNKYIKRIHSSNNDYQNFIKECDIMVYAMGFNSRNIPINGITDYKHNPYHGTIANNIYGIGIAYPEIITDEFGFTEQNVGLLKFAKNINKVFPVWNS